MMCFFCTNAYKLVLPWKRKVHTQDIPLVSAMPMDSSLLSKPYREKLGLFPNLIVAYPSSTIPFSQKFLFETP